MLDIQSAHELIVGNQASVQRSGEERYGRLRLPGTVAIKLAQPTDQPAMCLRNRHPAICEKRERSVVHRVVGGMGNDLRKLDLRACLNDRQKTPRALQMAPRLVRQRKTPSERIAFSSRLSSFSRLMAIGSG